MRLQFSLCMKGSLVFQVECLLFSYLFLLNLMINYTYFKRYLVSLIPLRITSRILASCTNMPIDILTQLPKNRPANNRRTTPRAITIFCFIRSEERRVGKE